MTTVIYKFPVSEGRNVVLMPEGSVPLPVAFKERDSIVFYALCPKPAAMRKREVMVLTTGSELGGAPEDYVYAGTVRLPDDPPGTFYVLHVFAGRWR